MIFIILLKLVCTRSKISQTLHHTVQVQRLLKSIIDVILANRLSSFINMIRGISAIKKILIILLLSLVQILKRSNLLLSILNLLSFQVTISNTGWITKHSCSIDFIRSFFLVSSRKITCINTCNLSFLLFGKFRILIVGDTRSIALALGVFNCRISFSKCSIHCAKSARDVRRLSCRVNCSLCSFNGSSCSIILFCCSFLLIISQCIVCCIKLCFLSFKLRNTSILGILLVTCIL